MNRVFCIALTLILCGGPALAKGEVSPARNTAAPKIPAPRAELMPDSGNSPAVDPSIFGGKRPGDRGIKPIDPPEKFDLPSPLKVAGNLVSGLIEIVLFVVQLALIALVVWIVVRAIGRKRDTGTVIPAKGEKTIFDIFDNAVTELKARRADRIKEVDEINKRLPENKNDSPQ